MLNKLWVRLSISHLLVAAAAVFSITFINIYLASTRIQRFITQGENTWETQRVVNALATEYAVSQAWDGERIADVIMRVPAEAPPQLLQGVQAVHPPEYTIANGAGVIVYSARSEEFNQPLPDVMLAGSTPIMIEGDTVGWVFVGPQERSAFVQGRFLTDLRNVLILTGLACLLFALGASLLISRVIVRPISALQKTVEGVGQGDLGKQVKLAQSTTTEIAALVDAFNRMSSDIAESEVERRRLTSDIAHELRTPLSVMRGHLQSMMDEYRPLSVENVAVVYEQTIHLTKLVEDLRTLANAESGHLSLDFRPVNPGDLLDQTEVLFRPVAEDMGLMFEVQAPPELPPMQADYARIRQVLDNLIINALRHVPAQGSIWLAVRQQEGRLRFDVANSGVTLDQRKAEHVFDRFWRADESRQRDTGGSGLGLSIARQIVQLHQGRIWVELGENRTTFSFEIPAA